MEDETVSEDMDDCISRDTKEKFNMVITQSAGHMNTEQHPFSLNESRINAQRQQMPSALSPEVNPVSILISTSESDQVKRLHQRCQLLEVYCKDLIHTNKVLDMENRLCIQ